MYTSVFQVENERFYRFAFLFILLYLLLSLLVLSYFLFTQINAIYALPICIPIFLLFRKQFNWLQRTAYVKYKNQALIIKGYFNRTLLAPLKIAEIDPMVKLSKWMIIRINFVLDGVPHSYFTFTHNSNFQQIKKRQAISRVL